MSISFFSPPVGYFFLGQSPHSHSPSSVLDKTDLHLSPQGDYGSWKAQACEGLTLGLIQQLLQEIAVWCRMFVKKKKKKKSETYRVVVTFEGPGAGWEGHHLEPEDETLIFMKDYIEKQRQVFCYPVLLLDLFGWEFLPSWFSSQRFNYFFQSNLFLLYGCGQLFEFLGG